MNPEKFPKYLTLSKIISKYNKVAIYNPNYIEKRLFRISFMEKLLYFPLFHLYQVHEILYYQYNIFD